MNKNVVSNMSSKTPPWFYQLNKNEVYCFFYRDFAAQFEHEFCKKKKTKQNKHCDIRLKEVRFEGTRWSFFVLTIAFLINMPGEELRAFMSIHA